MSLAHHRVTRSLLGHILRRLLGAILVVWVTVTVSFWAIQLIPGDPVDIMLGPLATISDEAKSQIRSELGLDAPPISQYFQYLTNLITGDLGTSYQLNQPVNEVLARALGPTAALALLTLFLACLLLLAGVLIARNRALQSVIGQVHIVATTVPIFWVSYLLLFFFAFGLGWFPATRASGLSALWLPSIALSIPVAGVLGQILHSGISDAHTKPFWVSVRSRGVSGLRFDVRHGIRHGLTSVVPLATQILGGLLGGAIIVEQVFSRPGLGSVALVAITNRDLPVVLGVVALSAVIFAVVAMLSEILVWMLDPRTRVKLVST